MQLRNGHAGERESELEISRRPELRRLWTALFILSMAPPVAWGVGSGASSKKTQEGPSEATIQAADDAQPLLVAASIVRSENPRAEAVRPTSAAAHYSARSSSGRALAAAPARRAIGSQSPQLVLSAQAAEAPSENAPLIQLAQPLPDVSAVGATTSRTARKEGFVAENPREAYPRIGEEPTQEEDALADPSSVDYRALRAAPPERRMRNAMHRVAASTAATLSTQGSFADTSSPERFNPGAASRVLDTGLHQASEAIQMVPGVRLESVALGAGYSSNGIPGSRFAGFNNSVGSDYDTNIRATFGAYHKGRTSSMSLRYTPSHVRRARLSEWNTTNHRLSLGVNKELGRRWAVGATAGASEGAMEQVQIEQPIFRTLTNAPTNLDDLFEQVRNGQLSDEEFASALTGTPVVERAAQRRLGLNRVLTLSTRLNASYTYSPRLSVNFGVGANSFRVTDNSFRRSFLADDAEPLTIRSFSSKTANASLNYRLSARRSVGVRQGMFFRDSNGIFGGSRASSTTASYNEKLGRRWSYGLNAGIGVLSGVNRLDTSLNGAFLDAELQPRATRSTWVASGNLSYSLGEHSFGVSMGRHVGDTISVGSSAAINGSASWNWSPRRAAWSLNAGAAYFQSGRRLSRNLSSVDTNGFRGFEAKMLRAGFSRPLSATTAFQTNYSFGRYSSPYQGLFSNRSVQRVQVAFVWRPVAER